MKRGGNHEGSVREHRTGLWQGKVRLLGKRITVYGHSEAEVRQKIGDLARQVTIYDTLPENRTLYQLFDEFLRHVDGSLKPRSVSDYRAFIRAIRAQMGDMPLQKLHQGHLRLLYSRFKETPRRANHIQMIMHRVLKLAVSRGWIDENPAEKVEPPKWQKKDKPLWSQEDCQRFLKVARENDWWPLVTFALCTGLRYGELSALSWTDVDTHREVVQVSKTLQRIDKAWVWGTPKTRSGRRSVYLGQLAFDALRRQRTLQAQWKLKAGPRWQEHGLIFTKRDGAPLHVSIADDALESLCRKLELPRISVHSLRHLYASLALQEGAPVALVSRQLGHANVGITTTIYSHAISDGVAVSEALGRALRGRGDVQEKIR